MAKQVFLPLLIAVVGLTFPSIAPTGFTLRVVDDQTGAAVPGLRVTDGNGMVRGTGAHGELIIWSNRPGPRFVIHDDTNQFDTISAIVPVTPGGQATVKVHRRIFR